MANTPQYLIGGTFSDASDHAPVPVINPCTEETLWHCPQCGPEHVQQAVEFAEKTRALWEATHSSQRANLLRETARLLAERAEEIGKVLSLEIGRPYRMAVAEANRGVETVNWVAGEADRLFGETMTSNSGGRLSITREPVGIVAAITPWNFPAGQALLKLAPALAAGCSIILRPSEIAPLTSTMIARCFTDAGFPAGSIQILHGKPEAMSDAIFACADIRKIAFTGSTAIGKLLLEKAARSVKRSSMELGGHSPVIVCDDADLDNAVNQSAMMKFANTGQICIAPTRFYVHENVAIEFSERMVAKARSYVLGDSQDPAATMGPLAHSAQREKLEDLIADAVARGARVLTGGMRPSDKNTGYFLMPTVLDQVPEDARIMREEPFGPVVLLTTFSSLADAIGRANSSEYALASYAFAGSLARCERLACELQAGVVGINNVDVSHHEAPFGGVKSSGIGREGGRYGIQEYLNIKTTHLTWAA